MKTVKRKVYIAGKITDDPNYREKFAKAEEELRDMGYELIMNPAILPEGFTWEQYMSITLEMLGCCDTIYLLSDWRTSRGAVLEKNMAEAKGMTLIFQTTLKTPNTPQKTPNKNND